MVGDRKEIVEITPIIFGGDPRDDKNKQFLTRDQHVEYVRYWNRIISDLRNTVDGAPRP
jgi:hypothetical protein